MNEGSGFKPRQQLSLRHCAPDRWCGSLSLICQGKRAVFLRIKRPEREADECFSMYCWAREYVNFNFHLFSWINAEAQERFCSLFASSIFEKLQPHQPLGNVLLLLLLLLLLLFWNMKLTGALIHCICYVKYQMWSLQGGENKLDPARCHISSDRNLKIHTQYCLNMPSKWNCPFILQTFFKNCSCFQFVPHFNILTIRGEQQ